MKGKNISEKEFGEIKVFQSYGIKVSKVSEMSGRGQQTIGRIFRAKDYVGYQELRDAHTNYQKKRKAVSTELRQGKDRPVPTTPLLLEVASDLKEALNRLDHLALAVNVLLEAENEKQASTKVSRWKFGG